jgi:adenylate cyclase
MSPLAALLNMQRLLGLCLIAGLLFLRAGDPALVSDLRFTAFDLFQRSAPRETHKLPVAIIDIDDQSLEELGQWPWPRSRMADLVSRMTAAGAVAIAFDIVFSEPDRLSPDRIAEDNVALPEETRAQLRALPGNDAVFAQAIAASRVIVGQTSIRSAQSPDAYSDDEVVDAPHAVIGGDPRPFLQRFPDLLRNVPVIEQSAAGRGMFSVRPDPDGIYRRVPLVMLVQDKIRLGLAPELLRVATGGDAFAIRVNEAGIEGVIIARQLVPTGRDGSVWPYLSPSVPDRYVSAADILQGRMPEGRLAGHLVLVGTSAIGLEDFRPTSLGVSMPGVEIHAQLLENILSQSLLMRPNYAIGAELTAVLVLSLLVVVLAPKLGAVANIALTLALMGSWTGISYYLFVEKRVLLDPVWPALCVLFCVMLMSSLNYLREERLRAHIRSAFGQYVSPELVARLAENREALSLGGERRDLTILFSDVRGFTTLAESYREDPAGLTSLMNGFLTVLSRAILDHRGTIDKFMGDAVMAFWNAPLDTPDHEKAACLAALRMVADIEAFNAFRAEASAKEGDEALPVDLGIGINSGECIVGNMGSDTRFDYTALGDDVNLASRLEGQSKAYGLKIILGERTAQRVADDFAVIELDRIRVKGKTLPARIFGLLGDARLRASDGFARLQEANTRMRAAYSAQEWDDARTALAELREQANDLDLPIEAYTALYQARLEAFSAHPPAPDWDGVYTAETK